MAVQAPVRLFTRPLPVLAAALLLLNDHVLKGSGALPGLVTGKLSDLAGLFFAPLLVSELVLLGLHRLEALRVLGACCLGVGALFVGVKLWPGANQVYVALSARVLSGWGLGAASVMDRTDLWALPMILLAFAYGRRALRGHGRRLANCSN